MKILVTNPPWIVDGGFFNKRSGVRAGSRWPFTFESSLPSILANKFKFKAKKIEEVGWVKESFKKKPWGTLLMVLDIILHKRRYSPYPVFMGYTVTYLQSKGIEAKFYDAIAENHSYKKFYQEVEKFKPEIIIMETSTPSFNIDISIAENLHNKGYEVCLVGPHATAFAEKLIELPFVDYILKGEYEYSALEMAQTRRRGVYDSKRVQDLDSMPYPYRDKKIIPLYREYCCHKNLAFPQLWVYGGRGCPARCNFCLWNNTMFNQRFTLRNPENILAEVEEMLKKYDFKYILFDDDCWNLGNRDRLMKIADGMQKFGLPWSIMGRLDTSDKEIFKYLADRGCVGIRLGVESLSQKLLDKTSKNLKVEFILDTLNYLKTLDVGLYTCFMHYIVGETQEDRDNQNAKIRELGLPHQNPPCIPFPGTPYYQIVLSQMPELKNINWDEYDGGRIGKNLKDIVRRYSEKN